MRLYWRECWGIILLFWWLLGVKFEGFCSISLRGSKVFGPFSHFYFAFDTANLEFLANLPGLSLHIISTSSLIIRLSIFNPVNPIQCAIFFLSPHFWYISLHSTVSWLHPFPPPIPYLSNYHSNNSRIFNQILHFVCPPVRVVLEPEIFPFFIGKVNILLFIESVYGIEYALTRFDFMNMG